MKKVKFLKVWLPVILVFVLVATAIIVYFCVTHKNDGDKEIICKSFDTSTALSFGKIDGVSFVEDKNNQSITINCPNADNFIDDYVLTSENYCFGRISESGKTYHIIVYDGYAYYLYKYSNKRVVCANLVCVTDSDIYIMPCVTTGLLFDKNYDNVSKTATVSYDDLNEICYERISSYKYDSYQSVKNFYNGLNPDLWEADDATKTIRVKVYKRYGYCAGDRLSTDFCVTMLFNDEERVVKLLSSYENF